MTEPSNLIIAAMTRNRVIGRDRTLPWSLPEDLALFKRLTLGHTVLMGRHTFASIGRPLPGRRNLVVSRTLGATPGVEVCRSFEAALEAAHVDERKLFFIGGKSIYRRALALAEAMHISWIHQEYPGNVFFPDFDLDAWQAESTEEYPAFTHVYYLRKRRLACGKPPGHRSRG